MYLVSSMLDKYTIPAITLRIENRGVIENAKDLAINYRNKHMDMRYQFMRDESHL